MASHPYLRSGSEDGASAGAGLSSNQPHVAPVQAPHRLRMALVSQQAANFAGFCWPETVASTHATYHIGDRDEGEPWEGRGA